MQIDIQGNSVTIDNEIKVTKVFDGWHITDVKVPEPETFGREVEVPEPVGNFTETEVTTPEIEYDDAYYVNGINGLTVQESAERAADYIVDEMWYEYPDELIGDYGLVFETCEKIIREDLGRDQCYRIAGRTKKVANVAESVGLTLAKAFETLVNVELDRA